MVQRAVPLAPESFDPRRIRIVYEVEETPGRWLLDEEDMPETPLHALIIELLKLILRARLARTRQNALVTSNLACRWDPSDARVGVDPDIVLIEPAPPEGERLTSLRIWEPGHVAPRVAVEVVSEGTATKDYLEVAARYGRLGAREVWVFDPLQVGPTETGGPFVLQVWVLGKSQVMERVHAGPGPAQSRELGCFLVVTDGGTRLRLADEENGAGLWLTEAEQEKAAREQEKAAGEQEKAAREQAEAALRSAILDLCELLDITPTERQMTHLASLDRKGLDELRRTLMKTRSWPR